MKKSVLLLAVIVFLLTVWSGLTWVVGNKAESYYRNLLADASQFGFVTYTNTSYERGFLQSKATTLMQIDLPAVKTRDCPDSEGTGAPDGEPVVKSAARTIQIEFKHVFHHGPLPTSSGPASRYGFGPAIALIETTLTRFAPDQEGLERLLAEIPELKESISVARIGFDGTTDSLFKVPAFAYQLEEGKIDASGFMVESTYSLVNGDLAGTFTLEHVVLNTPDGGAMNWQGLSCDFDLQKVLPMLFVGDSKAVVGTMQLTIPGPDGETVKTVKMEQMEMTSNSSFDGHEVEYQQVMSFGGLTIDGEIYGPLVIDASTKNLDAQALSDFQQQVIDIYKESSSLDPDALAGKVLPMYVDLFNKLVASDPEFNVRQFSLATPYGAAEGSFNLKITGIGKLDYQDPQAMLGYLQHIDSSADINVDEALVRAIMVANAKNSINEQVAAVRSLGQDFDMTESQIEDEAQQQYVQQTEMLISQKFIVRDGEKLKSSMTFRQGELMVNGQAVPLLQ